MEKKKGEEKEKHTHNSSICFMIIRGPIIIYADKEMGRSE